MRASMLTGLTAALVMSTGCPAKTTVVPPASACQDGVPPPAASAGADRTVARGTLVELDGAASAGHRDAGLAFGWQLLEAPAGSAAHLAQEALVTTSLVPDRPGVYVVGLVVDDGCTRSAMDVVTVVASNGAPLASAGPDRTAALQEVVQLDGTGSSDPEGDGLSYAWVLASRPAGSGATLSSAASPVPRLVPDLPGPYVVALTVSDGWSGSAPAVISINAGSGVTPPGCSGTAPVASAGMDQTLTRGSGAYLNGSGSRSTTSGASLSFQWNLVTVPVGSHTLLAGAGWVNPYFTLDRSGTYLASLVVYDGCALSAASTVTITVPNGAPVAKVGPDRSVPRSGAVVLDGSGASDPEGDPLSWSWTLVSRPAGSQAALSNTAAVRPALSVDGVGTYVVRLVVNDGYEDSAPATVTLSAATQPPVARISAPLPAAVGTTVSLDGGGSTDPQGDPLSYAWTLAPPPGSAATLSSTSAVAPSFSFDVDGTYRVGLTVSNGALTGSTQTAVVLGGAWAALPYQVVDAGYSRSLDRLVLATSGPNAVVVVDPATLAEVRVALPLPPTSISVSPDGLTAAVGHDAWISVVDLEAAAPRSVVQVPFPVWTLALGNGGFAYLPAGGYSSRIVSVDLSTGEATSGGGDYGAGSLRVSPDGHSMLAASSNWSLTRYDVSGGPPIPAWGLPSGSPACVGDAIWFAEDGARVFTRCGDSLKLSPERAADLVYAGSLSGLTSSGVQVRWLDHSVRTRRLAAFVGDSYSYYGVASPDSFVRLYDDTYLAEQQQLALPLVRVGTADVRPNGRYVFFTGEGARIAAVAQIAANTYASPPVPATWGLVRF